ncbi:MAG: DUF3108 domain-containing protein [Bacteroidetes bacterium]|nr:DUF3108 domain-containing protein [Bacteroidota bacterium]
MKKIITGLLLAVISFPLKAGDDFCGVKNFAFHEGENLTYVVFYSVIGVYINAGTATFNTSLENYNGKHVYHVTGTGFSNPSYDWIFKVRDKYETYIDTATLQPYKFIRNVDEGGYKTYENVTFNKQNSTAITTKGVYTVPTCVQDVLSAIYYARNIDFNKYKVDDKIPFDMFLDNEIYHLYVKYLGKETVKTKYGKFKAIKFKPLLIKGTIFEGGEKMTVWVSDDANHIPLRIESPISVGSIKVDMMQYKNLRHPLTSMQSFRM